MEAWVSCQILPRLPVGVEKGTLISGPQMLQLIYKLKLIVVMEDVSVINIFSLCTSAFINVSLSWTKIIQELFTRRHSLEVMCGGLKLIQLLKRL